jgi:hypothetical protein
MSVIWSPGNLEVRLLLAVYSLTADSHMTPRVNRKKTIGRKEAIIN